MPKTVRFERVNIREGDPFPLQDNERIAGAQPIGVPGLVAVIIERTEEAKP